jgi:hypothetical protein
VAGREAKVSPAKWSADVSSGNFQSIQVDAFREHVYVHAPTEHAQTEMVAVPLLIAAKWKLQRTNSTRSSTKKRRIRHAPSGVGSG